MTTKQQTKTDTKKAPADESTPAADLKEAPNAGSVTTTATTGNAVAVVDYGDDEGGGMEDVTAAEMLIPNFRVLQTNSPQVDENDAKYIAGAKAGMIINMATGELIDGKLGVELIPVYREHYFAEFIPRDAGGGFQGIKQPDDPYIMQLRKAQGEFGKLKVDPNNKDSNEFTETFSLYALLVSRMGDGENKLGGDIDTVGRGTLGFTSTQIQKYKSFITRYLGISYPGPGGKRVKPPLWAHRLLLQTVPQKNKKGSFFGWKLTFFNGEPPVRSRMDTTDPLYQEAKEFYTLIKSGAAKADYAAAAGEADGGGVAKNDEEIPF